MTAEKAVQWIIEEKFNQWRLFRNEDEKVSEYDSEDENESEATERLRRILELQQAGKYVLKGYRGKSKQAAQSTFRFDIKAPTMMHQSNSGGPANWQEALEQGKQLALAEMMANKWKDDVIKRLDTIESDIQNLQRSLLDLTDGEEENDEDAIDRITGIAERLPKLAQGFDSLKGMLGKR